MRWSWRLGSLLGIDIYIHVTFLALLGWIAVSHLARGHDLGLAASGIALVLLVFAIVVFHELGHALMARRFGIGTRDITLLPIGGVSRLERMPEKPAQELLVAIAGPAVNLALALLLLGALELLEGVVGPGELQVVGGSFLSKLFWINVSLAVFNLIPAFPMDGGRVLRALFALRVDRARATVWAARIGQGIAALFAVAGVLWNPMLLLIALFVWMGAQQESAAVQMRAALRGVSLGEVMITSFETLAATDPLARAAARLVAGFQHDFPVLEDGRPVGVLTRADLARGLTRHGAEAPVGDVMRRDFAVADPGEMLETVIARLGSPGCCAIVAVRGGQVVGMVTPETLGGLVLFEPVLRHAGRGGG
jgi:Zn-dependent protease/CBS domain-containing protein